jgi:glycolate oxidase
MYHPVTPEIIVELKRIVGEKHVLFGDTERLEPFAHDEVAEAEYAHLPEAAVSPGSAEEIAAIMK